MIQNKKIIYEYKDSIIYVTTMTIITILIFINTKLIYTSLFFGFIFGSSLYFGFQYGIEKLSIEKN